MRVSREWKERIGASKISPEGLQYLETSDDLETLVNGAKVSWLNWFIEKFGGDSLVKKRDEGVRLHWNEYQNGITPLRLIREEKIDAAWAGGTKTWQENIVKVEAVWQEWHHAIRPFWTEYNAMVRPFLKDLVIDIVAAE